jgi:hypothetical protein
MPFFYENKFLSAAFLEREMAKYIFFSKKPERYPGLPDEKTGSDSLNFKKGSLSWYPKELHI